MNSLHDRILVAGDAAEENQAFQFPFIDTFDPSFRQLYGILAGDFDMTFRCEIPEFRIDIRTIRFLSYQELEKRIGVKVNVRVKYFIDANHETKDRMTDE